MDHAKAQRMGPQGQGEYLEKLLQEKWWQEDITEYRVLARRTPAEWGSEYSLRSRQHESRDDGEVHAGGKTRAPQP